MDQNTRLVELTDKFVHLCFPSCKLSQNTEAT